MRPKMLMVLTVVLLAVSLLFAAANVKKEGKDWLAQFSAAPAANIGGTWNEKNWGKITLEQVEDQASFTGKGDGWYISGVVSANKAYLLFAYKNGNIAYSAILENQGSDSWTGEYYNGLLSAKRDKMTLVRANSPAGK